MVMRRSNASKLSWVARAVPQYALNVIYLKMIQVVHCLNSVFLGAKFMHHCKPVEANFALNETVKNNKFQLEQFKRRIDAETGMITGQEWRTWSYR